MSKPSPSSDIDPEWLAAWERERAGGMRRFVWSHGVLRWGGFMFCFSLAVFQYAHFGAVLTTEGNWLMRISIALVTWIFVGYGYGRSQWRRNEQIYLRYRPGGSGQWDA
jgi:hypothetical protein